MPSNNKNPKGGGRGRRGPADPRLSATTVPPIRLLMRAYGAIKSKLNPPKDRRAVNRGKNKR